MATAVKDLSPAQCILLTVHYASSANITALHSLTPSRLDCLDPTLVLRILLSYLPETVDPTTYTSYVSEVASRLYLDIDRPEIEVDTTPVGDLEDTEARKRVKKLNLVGIEPPKAPPHVPDDLLTHFLVHRAQNIDTETGMLNLVPALVEPFLARNQWIRVWYISSVLPLLRMNFEYYPEDPATISLLDFSETQGRQGIDILLERAKRAGEREAEGDRSEIGRDVKSLVGPWMYGHTERKRRKLAQGQARSRQAKDEATEEDGNDKLAKGVRKISLSGVTEDDKTGHDWEYAYIWMVQEAREQFALVTHLIEDWDGPSDVDFGGYEKGEHRPYLDDDVERKLELQYAQAAFAACYATTSATEQTVRDSHAVLARLAELLDFIPPPDLASSVDSLPLVERHTTVLNESQTVADLAPEKLLRPEHPLTTPRMETYMLLQMMVYSAYQLLGLGHTTTLAEVAKMQFYGTAEGQMALLQKMLRGLASSGKREETQWVSDRAKLLWLWNWGIDNGDHEARNGAGVLGMINREDFEAEMLKVFTDTSCYPLIRSIYLNDQSIRPLPLEKVEKVLLSKALEAYDGASNGNRTRGGVKRANDIINAFKPQFPSSEPFHELASLINATHALSFYSLTLQHGVPFQPVSIRVSHDPIALLEKVLDQNPRAYTQLDDLIGIAQRFVDAGLPTQQEEAQDAGESTDQTKPASPEARRTHAERRVTFLAIETALRANDFETAYSYIVNRLTPSAPTIPNPSTIPSTKKENEDDTSWRAAFLAGRFRPVGTEPSLRNLSQRTELLSLALLLAPTPALPEILSAWRRCEEETTALHLAQTQAEEEFDDHADKRRSGVPGGFVVGGEQPALVLGQERREVGRVGGGKGGDEGPVSMFDLTRSAARALGKGLPLGGGGQAQRQTARSASMAGSEAEGDLGGQAGGERVRRRDMAMNAVSGGLASGLGWVLGATPVDRQ